MSRLLHDVDLVNHARHEQVFNYLGKYSPGRTNKAFMELHHISEWRDHLQFPHSASAT